VTPGRIRATVVLERISRVREMVGSVRALPLSTYGEFVSDKRNVASAESFLRRGIEALLDLGRHVLAKGFGVAVPEYKEIGLRLHKQGVFTEDQAALFRMIAGYRNRMVHFYREVTDKELYDLCTQDLQDIERILDALVAWLHANSEKLDSQI